MSPDPEISRVCFAVVVVVFDCAVVVDVVVDIVVVVVDVVVDVDVFVVDVVVDVDVVVVAVVAVCLMEMNGKWLSLTRLQSSSIISTE